LVGKFDGDVKAMVRVDLSSVKFRDVENKEFEVIQVFDKLCEFCRQPVEREERKTKMIRITQLKDFEDLQKRARAHERVEVDFEENRIYLYDLTYPCIFHPACLEKYAQRR